MCLKDEIIESIVKQFKRLSGAEIVEAIQKISEGINSKDVICLPFENNGIKSVHVSDIIYLDERKKKNVYIITKDGEFAYNNYACNILSYLEENHENFKFINTTQMINLDQMKTYHSYLNRVYYTDSDKIYLNCNGKAVNKKGFIKVHLGTENDRIIKEVFPRREYASKR
jgi:hypothetical protein